MTCQILKETLKEMKELCKNAKPILAYKLLRKYLATKKTISFDLVSPDMILKEIEPLDPNKTTHSDSVPIKIVKANADLSLNHLSLNLVFNAYN